MDDDEPVMVVAAREQGRHVRRRALRDRRQDGGGLSRVQGRVRRVSGAVAEAPDDGEAGGEGRIGAGSDGECRGEEATRGGDGEVAEGGEWKESSGHCE